MIEHERWVDTGSHRLSGTLCLPAGAGPFPWVLMLHGTGPLDRDENMRGQRLDVFNRIAHHLAAHGVASLRYDKRGCGKSGGEYWTAGQADFLADAVAWVDSFAGEPTCDRSRVFLLGHSEGCLLAPRVSLERPWIAGLVLLCPTVTPFETVLMQQAGHIEREIERMAGFRGALWRAAIKLVGRPTVRQRQLIERIKTTNEPTIKAGFQLITAKSFRELMQLDVRAIFERVPCPALVVGGSKDVQCDPADVAVIVSLNPRFEGEVIPDLTHLLRFDDGEPSIFGYAAMIKRPFDPRVLARVETWLRATCDKNRPTAEERQRP